MSLYHERHRDRPISLDNILDIVGVVYKGQAGQHAVTLLATSEAKNWRFSGFGSLGSKAL